MSKDNERPERTPEDEKDRAINIENLIKNIRESDDYMAVAIRKDENGTCVTQSVFSDSDGLGKMIGEILISQTDDKRVVVSLIQRLFMEAVEKDNWDQLEMIKNITHELIAKRTAILSEIATLEV